jgi:hypothetical protein
MEPTKDEEKNLEEAQARSFVQGKAGGSGTPGL